MIITIKKKQSFGGCIITSGEKKLIHLAVSGNGWGGSTSLDVSAVHNYDLKKKTYSRLAIGRNDNFDPKKKVQLSGEFIIMSGKIRVQLSGRQWEWLGGFHELGCFGGIIITT